MTLIIHLLGQPKFSIDSTPIKFNAPPKTIPLLAYLLLHRRQTLERQNVAFALWPDEPESAARANLRRHIHQLQNALPAATPERPWLMGDSRLIGWNPLADFWLDVAEFEHLCGQPDRLDEAATCYTGDLLETSYDDWVFFERERLLNQYFDILTRLVYQHRERRDYPKAITFARQLLNRDAFREDTLRQLIVLRYESGDRAGAIQEYKTFEHRLRDEISVSPMLETQSLYELVLHNDRLPDSDNFQPAASDCLSTDEEGDFPLLLPFVGRETEMERVSAWWSRAARGHGGLGLIGGEAGVGKSRLARQISLLVESQGGRVLIGRTSPKETRPYQAVVEALQSVLPLLAAQSGNLMQLAALNALVPELKTRCALPDLPPLDTDRERIRLFGAAAGSLEQLAATRPMLLILEDLHWAGESTAALVEFLARRATQCPILILGTYRDEETPRLHPLRQLRRRLQGDVAVEHTALSRLSPGAVDCLLTSLPLENLPAPLPNQSLSSHLYTESEGNPLFIGMLLQSWRQHSELETVVIPGGIRAAIKQQLERLPSAALAFAEVAAVLGPAFSAEAAREVGGWDEAQAHKSLRALLDSRLVWEAEGRSRFDYFFSHHLIQAALYSEIPTAKRQRRHHRAAEVLEELYPERRSELAGELASHYDLGGAPALSIPHYLEAARQWIAVFADQEALTALRRALQLAEATPVNTALQTVFELLLLRESIHARRGERDEQRTTLQHLEHLATELDNLELACEISRRQILFYKAVDDRPAQKAQIGRLQHQASALGSRHWLAEAVFAEGNYRKLIEEYPEAIERLEQALAFYREAQQTEAQVRCCCLLSEIFIIQRQSITAEAWAQRALTLCKDAIPTHPLMYTLWNLSANGLVAKDLERCLRYAGQLLESAQQAHDIVWQAAGSRLLGMADQHLFRIPEARQHLKAALDLYRLAQKPKGRALTLQTMGHVEISVGNFEAGLQNYLQAYELNERLGDQMGMATESINLGFAAALQGEHTAEKEYARRAIPLTRQIHNRFLEGMALQCLGEAERELDEWDSARQHLNESLSLLEDVALILERTGVQADLALAHWKTGDWPLALQMVDQVLAAYPQVAGKEHNVHRFLWTAAQILRSAGQTERAAQVLEQAYQAFQKNLALLPETETRQTFAKMKHNRQIAAAYERGEWP
ncbi:MAG: hypothetical protein CVU44_15555 [Chloroflexi bacterium HGW-Chloroflexi-6]|nr:MAG: hypothetical protein CVU44_15555 [Chloroflexi bacterium HGW-Chloroflexi-6]